MALTPGQQAWLSWTKGKAAPAGNIYAKYGAPTKVVGYKPPVPGARQPTLSWTPSPTPKPSQPAPQALTPGQLAWMSWTQGKAAPAGNIYEQYGAPSKVVGYGTPATPSPTDIYAQIQKQNLDLSNFGQPSQEAYLGGLNKVPTEPMGILDTIRNWISPQQPAQAVPENWQKGAKDVFGESQPGQSLLDTMKKWISNVGRSATEPPIGTALAQPSENITAPGQIPAPIDITGGPEKRVPPTAELGPENKFWWEGGLMAGPPSPEQLNTPTYIEGYLNVLLNPENTPEFYTNGKLNEAGQQALDNAWADIVADAKAGFYSPEGIGKEPKVHEALVAEMLFRDSYDQKWVESLQDASLGKVVTQVASQDPTKLPPTISQERLDAMVRGPDFATLYDTGYRSEAYQAEVTDVVKKFADNYIASSRAAGITPQIIYNPADLDTLTYANIEGLKQQLSQLTPAEIQKIAEGGAQIALKTEFWKFNVRGESVNRGEWDITFPPQSEMTQSEKDRYIDQQQFYNDWYWSEEATTQRQKEREESWEYYHEKDLEGWKEYYATLDGMELYPDASEYWSQPGKFAELRRKWETSDSGLSWDAWLQQFDFEGEWYMLAPQERGEKKYIYSPRMIRLNY